MKTIDDVLKQNPGALAAASELARRFRSDPATLRDAAIRWMDRTAASDELRPLAGRDSKDWERVYTLVHAATVGFTPLHDWAKLAREEEYRNASGRTRIHIIEELLELIVFLWPYRKDAASLSTRTVEWVTKVSVRCAKCAEAGKRCGTGSFPALLVARALGEYTDLAYAIVGAVQDRTGLRADELPPMLALKRMARRLPPDPRDHAAIEHFGISRVLTSSLPMSALRDLMESRAPVPPPLQTLLDGALTDPTSRCEAAGVLCAVPAQHERAVRILADETASAKDPREALERAMSGGLGSHRIFDGTGWGAVNAAKKLKPLVRSYVRRGVWPLNALARALPRDDADRGGHERADEKNLTRVLDLLAEGMLAVAVDGDEMREARELALAALERLAPRDESFAKALTKLATAAPHLADAARSARKSCGQVDHDPELAMKDACEIFGLEIVERSPMRVRS